MPGSRKATSNTAMAAKAFFPKAVFIIFFTSATAWFMGYVNEKKANGSIIPSWNPLNKISSGNAVLKAAYITIAGIALTPSPINSEGEFQLV